MLLLTLSLAALLGIVACANAPSTDTAAVPTTTPAPSVAAGSPAIPAAASNDYRIGPQDLLKIDVFGVEALSKRSVRVNASGQISLPLIGALQAGGLTAEQLAADIAARLAKDYLQNPQVIIFIEEFTSQRVTVTGAVRTPNVFPLKGRTTLLQVVAQAGGATSVANLGAVRILRSEPDGTRKTLEYDLAAIQNGAAPDPEVRGEDVVQVETSALKEAAKQATEFILPFWIFAR
ncbi:MAG: polysaccharide export protein [Candidatus Contendobacter sp.]|nr:polysaccharide export protein [Candidatus Contendobacter sp.]MDG4558544.1 polysaccharide export protein [Candidatus Contendobacter sp.]